MCDAKRQRQEEQYFRPFAVQQDRAKDFSYNIIDTYDDIVLFDVNVSIVAFEVLLLDTWYGNTHNIKRFVDFDYIIVNNKKNAIAKIIQSRSMLWQEQIPKFVAYKTKTLIEVTYAPKFLYAHDVTSELTLLSNFLCTFDPHRYISISHVDYNYVAETVSSAIEVLNEIICSNMKLLYLERQGLGYIEFISKHTPYEVGFDVILICAIINFLCKNAPLSVCLDGLNLLIDQCRCSVFIYTYKKLTSNTDELVYLLREVFHKDPIVILQYITHHRHNLISDDDITEVAIQKTFESEIFKNDTNVYMHIVFPFFFSCISPTLHDVNIYRNGQYSNVSRVDACSVLKPMLNVAIHKKKSTIITAQFETYIAKLQASAEPKYTPGKYRHFINTKIGVFCTITGTYTRKTPFIHFLETSQEKNFCLLPPIPHQDESLNMKCIRYQSDEPIHLSQSIDNIDLMWFSEIYIPNARTQKYTAIELKKLMFILKSRVKRQHQEFFRSYVIVCPHIVTFLAHCISKVSWLNNTDPFVQLMQIIETTCDDDIIKLTTKPEDRALAYALLLIENRQIKIDQIITFTMSPDLNVTLRYIVEMCGWDTVMVKEFLAYFSNLYRPSNEHKKFLLLHGVSDSGKSTFVQYLKDWHGHSQCSQNGVLKASDKSEGPGTTLATIAKSYTTIIHETKEISSSVIKILTGQDDVDLRAHFAKHAQTIVPISFILCVSNQFPKMELDGAILNRIVIFHLDRQFKPFARDQLKMFIHNQIPIKDDTVNCGQGLANLFFFASKLYLSTPECMKNKLSIKALAMLTKTKPNLRMWKTAAVAQWS